MWQKLLNYYLDSPNYFEVLIDLFLDLYLYEEDGLDGSGLQYQTEAARQIRLRMDQECGVELTLPAKEIEGYFCKEYSDEQLFAVIFARWLGFSASQTKYLRDKRRSRLAWPILNCLMADVPTDEIEKIVQDRQLNTIQKQARLSHYRYQEIYYITKDDGSTYRANLKEPPNKKPPNA